MDFECFFAPRSWTDEEITRLRIVAEIVASGAGRRRAELDLARQLSFELQIADLSRRFLDLEPEQVDAEVSEALEIAADLAGVDRSYLLTFMRRTGGFDLHEWHDPQIEPPAEQISHPWATEKVLSGEPIILPDVSDLPEEAAPERENLIGRGVLSLLVLPIHSADKIVGLIAFESMSHRRKWSEQHVTLLRLAGELLTTAVRRKRSVLALRESQSQVLQSQKMEAVGRLAGGVAHDFNNLLTIILGNSGALLRGLTDDDPNREDAQEIHDAANRAASLTRQLLNFSRRPIIEPRLVDLGTVVNGLESMLSRLIGEDIELSVVCENAPCLTRGDPGQLEQMVINLVVNARDAMPEGGKLTVHTDRTRLSETDSERLGAAGPGEYVRLEIADTGAGMSEETIAHAFEPFFTTKGQDQGTGLGLSMVYNIAHRSGGTVGIESMQEEGTRVRVLLPVASGPLEVDEPPSEPVTGGAGETVLVVEDEHAVRRLIRRILEQAGYRVLEAENGEKALAVEATHVGDIHLLVTDLVMPGMRGDRLAARLRERRPDTRVLFVTGYSEEESRAALRSHQSLQKPFTDHALLQNVRCLLDESAPVPQTGTST
jgi:signal transduction histidine kinase/CheY-like chemotaxis protein